MRVVHSGLRSLDDDETLAENGYHVYAGARKDKDLEALNAIGNVTAVKLDVTKQDQVDAVVEMIRKKGTGLYGLVNNAGVGGGGQVTTSQIFVAAAWPAEWNQPKLQAAK